MLRELWDTQLIAWGEKNVTTLGDVAAAAAVLAMGVALAWLVGRVLRRVMSNGGRESRLTASVRHATFWVLVAAATVWSVELAGVPFRFGAVWNYELFRWGGGAQPHRLLVNHIVVVLATAVVGLLLSHWLAKAVGTYLRNRHVDPTAAEAIQKAVFSTMLVIVVLMVLQLINVPVTSLAFLGGALALGVGFGAQNIINNFISGWILVGERPVRIGDLIEAEGFTGVVESIGARCTRIRRADGVDILVPNSKLLQDVVANWTLIDESVRGVVRVGVAYGSPTDKVAQTLQQAAAQHPKVLPDPKPQVLFQDFGDNALVFDVSFWTAAAHSLDVGAICSDVRFKIDAMCREAGIALAFPQRDVHLDTARPLDIRLVGPQDTTDTHAHHTELEQEPKRKPKKG